MHHISLYISTYFENALRKFPFIEVYLNIFILYVLAYLIFSLFQQAPLCNMSITSNNFIFVRDNVKQCQF